MSQTFLSQTVILSPKFKCDLSLFDPLPDDKILDWSKLKQFADDNFKFVENSRKFSKRVENTVGKGEIARYEQFLLFPLCFQKDCFPGASKRVIVWEWVNAFQHYGVRGRQEERRPRNVLSSISGSGCQFFGLFTGPHFWCE